MKKTAFNNSNRGKSRFGIQWKMYAILIAFLGIAVGIIWFFQVQMLTYFYQQNKFNELEYTSALLSQSLVDLDSAEDIADKYSTEYYEDIWICKVKNNTAKIYWSSQSSGEPIGYDVVRIFDSLYGSASKNDGNYIALMTYANQSGRGELKIIKDNFGDPMSFPFVIGNSNRLQAVYVTLKSVGGEEYMIVQSTGLTPVAAISKALKHQFLWIGFILSVLALITAWLMSKIITKPIVNMNASAKRLAKGEYNTDFSAVSGYLEIDELADSLNYASTELAKTHNLQRELISNISHDLRTPLTMIKGYGEVMRDIPGENTPENIQIIIDETSRLSELVNDMLDLSKIQAGTRKPQMQRFSLTETVRETMQRYERLTMQDGYSISFESGSDAYVNADRGMILQVVYNLINNAINYTGEDKLVCVRQTLSDGRVRISVTDTGEGIAEEELKLIWERYYKVDKVHKRATVGTGLGLSIVKEVLELHGASYGVQSTVGKGATFWFELPIDESTEAVVSSDGYIEADYEEQNTEFYGKNDI